MRYCLPSDLIEPASVTSVFDVDPGYPPANADAAYPLTNLYDGLPTEVTRWSTTEPLRVIWDQVGTFPVEGFLLVMHTFAAGATLQLHGNHLSAWNVPTIAVPLTVPPPSGGLPANLVADLRATTFSSIGYQFLGLALPAQAATHGIGEAVWIRTWRTLASSVAWPYVRSEQRRAFANTTAYGVEHVVDRGVRQRRLSLRFAAISDADRDALFTLVREAGADLSFAVVMDPDEHTEFGPRADALLVRLTPESVNQLVETLQFFDVNDVQLDALEVQRGLAI